MARVGVDKFYPVFGKERKKIYPSIGFEDVTTTQQYERMYQRGGYGYAQIVLEGGIVPIDTFATLYNKDYYWVKRGLGDKRTFESIETDQYGIAKDVARLMAKAMEDTKEATAANLFNNMTSTATAYVGPDSVALVSASHPYDGGTWNNRGIDSSATDADLSITALEGAMSVGMQTVNQRGIPDPRYGPWKLMVHPSNWALANRLAKAQKFPQSNDNDPNPAGAMITDVIVNPFLTDADAWMLIAEDNGLFQLKHGARRVQKKVYEETESVAIFLTEKWLFHFFDGRGIVGTVGA